MAEIQIHLRYNTETGQKDIMIKYESDGDALPHEHESRHKEIVEELVGKGILNASDVGKVTSERVSSVQQVDVPRVDAIPDSPLTQNN